VGRRSFVLAPAFVVLSAADTAARADVEGLVATGSDLAVGGALLAACAALVWLALRIRRRRRAIDELGRAVERLAAGEVDADPPVVTDRSLGKVASALALMATRHRDVVFSLRERERELEEEIERGRAVTARLNELNAELRTRAGMLEHSERELTTLGELADSLHACRTLAEAAEVVTHFARTLFSGSAGALFVFERDSDTAVAQATWGPSSARDARTTVEREECWGLRRGKPHVVKGPAYAMRCPHHRHHAPAPTICLPLLAQGSAIGVLHLRRPAPARGKQVALYEDGEWNDAIVRLATTFSEHVGLALANVSLREELERQAIRDELTGLHNRRYMEDALDRELARALRARIPLSLVLVDLDHFKRVNDTLGHAAGDAVLRAIGHLLEGSVRRGDLACRYGGEEFALLLHDTSMEQAGQRAAELLQRIRDSEILHEGRPIGAITASAGVATWPDHGGSPSELMEAADRALYDAKARGRDAHVLAS
jgi:diguanylate cyclase (GGDEF)-like protein